VTSDPHHDPFEVLGVTPAASDADVRRARRRLLKAGAHPDTADQCDIDEVAVRTQISSEINRAYQEIIQWRRETARIGEPGVRPSPDTDRSAQAWADASRDDYTRHQGRTRPATVAGLLLFLRHERLGQWIAVCTLTIAGVPLGLVAEPYAAGDLAVWAVIVMLMQAAIARRLHHTPLEDAGQVVAGSLRLAARARRAIASLLPAF
jgi:hypothetical protein